MGTEWTDFADLPDEARVWVYGFENDLNTDAKNTVSEALRRFIPTWTSHQHLVKAAFAVILNRFALAADSRSELNIPICQQLSKALSNRPARSWPTFSTSVSKTGVLPLIFPALISCWN